MITKGGNYRINWDCPQAMGLVFVMPMLGVNLIDKRKRTKFTVTGSPNRNAHDQKRAGWLFTGAGGSSGDYLIGDSTPLTGPPFSLSCWFYPLTAVSRTLISLNASANATHYFALSYQATSQFCRTRASDTTSATSAASAGAYVLNDWNFTVGVHPTLSSRYCYVGGSVGKGGNNTATRTTTGINRIALACLGGSTISEILNGRMADCRVYNKVLTDKEVDTMNDPSSRYDLYEFVVPMYRIGFAGVATLQTLNLSGSITPGGSLIKMDNKLFAGSITPSGINVKTPKKNIGGTVTPTGNNIKTTGKLFAGVLSFSGAFIKQPKKLMGGGITPIGAVIKKGAKNMLGSITPSGLVVKQPHKNLSGSLSSSGSLSLFRTILILLSGSVSFAGTLLTKPSKLFAGSISPSGIMARMPIKKFAGSISPSGVLSTLRTILLVIGGSLSFVGSMIKRPNKLMSGTLSPIGSMVKTPIKKLAGSISPSGVMSALRTIILTIAGSLSFSGSMIKRPNKLMSGSVTPLGNLLRRVNKIMSGSVTPIGIAQLSRTAFIFIAGSISPEGTLRKTVVRILGGAISPNGAFVKTARIVVGGTVSMSGDLTTLWIAALHAVSTTFKAMYRGIFKGMR